MDLSSATHQPAPAPAGASLVFTAIDVALVALAAIALVGCICLLVLNHEPPNWLSGIVLGVVGYYSGALRHA